MQEVGALAEFLRAQCGHSQMNRQELAGFVRFPRGTPGNADCKIVTRLFTGRRQTSDCEAGNRIMDIRFVSSLTSEDEKLFAPALLKAVAALLDQLPIAYTVRIETTGADVFQHAHAAPVEIGRAHV